MQRELKRGLESNIWKFFIFILSQRRNFIPILSIYFLTLPDTTAQQIGIYSGVGFLLSFLFEIPSGYFADRFGHKKTLILAKLLMIISTISFIVGDSFPYFIVGSALLSLSFAFTSGTKSAFMHETLASLHRDKEYTKIMSKIAANVSIVSMALIMLLPFFTKIKMVLPLQINLGFDFIGLVAVLSLANPQKVVSITKKNSKSILSLVKEVWKIGFFPPAIFTGAVIGFLVGTTPFKEIYLQSLGYPVIFIGFVMGLSRLFWFVIGHKAHVIEKQLTMKQLFFVEIFLFSGLYFLIAYLSHPFVVGLLFSVAIGYMWGRSEIITHYLLRNFISDKRYTATILSIKGQISHCFQTLISLLVGVLAAQFSYKFGYYITSILLFVTLGMTYFFIKDDK